MRTLSYSFRFSPPGHGKILANALLHHAFPKVHQLLFAYDYRYYFVIKSYFNYLIISFLLSIKCFILQWVKSYSFLKFNYRY